MGSPTGNLFMAALLDVNDPATRAAVLRVYEASSKIALAHSTARLRAAGVQPSASEDAR